MKTLSLRARILLPVLVGSLVLASVLSAYFISSIIKSQNAHLESISDRTIGLLANALEYSVLTENISDSKQLVDWLISQPDIYSMKVTANEKVLINKKCREDIKEIYLKSFKREISLRTTSDPLLDMDDIVVDSQPEHLNNKIIGHVEIVVSSLDTAKKTQNEIIGAVIFVLIVFVLTFTLALLAINSTNKSIKTILEGISKMGKGDLSARISIDDEKELGDLAKRFNTMASRIEQDELRLMEANALQRRFMSTMSHDLRSPLGIILSMIELTLSSKKLDAHSKMHLTSGMSAGKQLLRLIDDVLDIGKLEKGEDRLNITQFDLQEVVEQAFHTSNSTAKQKGLLTKCSFHNLPKSKLILSDQAKLTRIFNNLIGNAIKFTVEGSIIVNTHCNLLKDDTLDVEITIKDTGIGISDTDKQKIFEPFKQVGEDTSIKFGGSGLGLSIVSEYVKLMKGSISVESALGLGSQFKVKFNFPTADCLEKNTITASETVVSSINGKVLFIDDNLDYHQIVKEYLKTDLIDCASNGHDGLIFYKKYHPKIVLLDCQMPDMNGFEVAKRIREFEISNKISACKIIALTANAVPDLREQCLDAGMNDFLTKPFNKNQLLSIVSNHI